MQDVFGRADKLVVLAPTGDVVLKETWEKVLKPDGEFKGEWPLLQATWLCRA
jgi:nitric oxide synthase-interacting protein